jgi:hypothetical protein
MRAITLVAGSIFMLSGCVASSDRTDSTTQSLGISVVLPEAIGGDLQITNWSRRGAPAHVYSTGLPIRPTAAHALSGAEVSLQNNPNSPPPTLDISKYAPKPGDQGQTGSCATWATGYSAMGWWAKRMGLTGAPYAPMFLYAQQVYGQCDQGTQIEDNLGIMQDEGIDTAADYEPMQQQLDCQTQPDSQQLAVAGQHRISGYQQIDVSNGASTAIRQALATKVPVILGIIVYDELMNVDSQNYIVSSPQEGEQPYGGHAITAFKYDDKGVWILNSWGSQWGKAGWAELSWDFVDGSLDGQANVMDAALITGVVK